MSQVPPPPPVPPTPPPSPSPYSPNPPSFPPTQGGGFEPEPARNSWPRVIGIVSIVWGSLGLVCNGCGLVMQVFQSAMMSMIPQPSGPNAQQLPPIPDVMKPTALEVANMGAGLVICVVLIIAGAMLAARNPKARAAHLAYAGLSILATVVGTAIFIQKQSAIMAWAKQNPDNLWAKSQTQGANFAFISIGFGVLLGLAYPLFILFWFLAVKRDSREITEGSEEPIV